jgi:8-oxo-dGTP diphosphatase
VSVSDDPSGLHYTEYDTRLAAYAVILREGDGASAEVLLALWNEPDPKRWTLPGGGVDLDESTEEGCVREVREETGYDVELTGLLGLETDVIDADGRRSGTDRPLKAVRVFYGARVVGGELRREVGGTTDEARWIPVEQLPEIGRVSMVDTGLRLLRDPSTRR